MQRFDVVIVGAGIVGSGCARECASAGLRVAVVEGGQPAGGATAAGMGHVVVMDDSPAQLALTVYSRSLWMAQANTLPDEVEYRSRGTLWVAADDDEMGEAQAKYRTLGEAGVASALLNPTELRDEEPNLREGLAGGLLVADDGVSYPPASARYFLAESERLGGKVFFSKAVSAGDGAVRLSDGTVLYVDRIVLATGTDCALLPALPLKKRKGHLVIMEPAPGFVHHQVVELGYIKGANNMAEDSVAFNIQPRVSGKLWVGASRQYGDEHPGVDEWMVKRVMDRAVSYIPALRGLRVERSWAGFRAATEDKLPLIGPAKGLSDDPTLWLAVGFEGLGITCSLGAARLVTDSLLGRKSVIDPAPYLPIRMSA